MSTIERHEQFLLIIDNTRSAAFVEAGRDHAIADTIKEIGGVLVEWDKFFSAEEHLVPLPYQLSGFPVRDVNGNDIGCFLTAPDESNAQKIITRWANEQSFVLNFAISNDSFQGVNGEQIDQTAHEINAVLNRVADAMLSGQRQGPVRDTNGNTIGAFTWAEPPSLVNDDGEFHEKTVDESSDLSM